MPSVPQGMPLQPLNVCLPEHLFSAYILLLMGILSLSGGGNSYGRKKADAINLIIREKGEKHKLNTPLHLVYAHCTQGSSVLVWNVSALFCHLPAMPPACYLCLPYATLPT